MSSSVIAISVEEREQELILRGHVRGASSELEEAGIFVY
jgi:hypothetical protein